jgi:hypothetical protein
MCKRALLAVYTRLCYSKVKRSRCTRHGSAESRIFLLLTERGLYNEKSIQKVKKRNSKYREKDLLEVTKTMCVLQNSKGNVTNMY